LITFDVRARIPPTGTRTFGEFVKRDFEPLLEPGFHAFDGPRLARAAVLDFPNNTRRRAVFDALITLRDELEDLRLVGEIWIDGSFMTRKPEPNDVDVLLRTPSLNEFTYTPVQLDYIRRFRGHDLLASPLLDYYHMWVAKGRPETEWLTAYWTRQFGFGRDFGMKGIAVLRLGEGDIQ
jgi:hypothetical protein